jgi:leader peptidase (prepilin peptidase)/N-methyltransferase
MTIKQVFLGILFGGGTLYFVALVYYLLKKQEGMGGGDIKLLAMIGAATGVNGVFFTIFTGSLIGTLAGVGVMLHTRLFDSKLKIAFGPFLSAGAIAYIFWGEQLIGWYLNLLSG